MVVKIKTISMVKLVKHSICFSRYLISFCREFRVSIIVILSFIVLSMYYKY